MQPAPVPDPGETGLRETEAWALSESVELRPEPFGALAYDFSTRQLSFLKTLTLAEVVRALAGSGSVGEALTRSGVADGERAAYLLALGRLARTGLIRERVA